MGREQVPEIPASGLTHSLSIVPTAPKSASPPVVSVVSGDQAPGEAVKITDSSLSVPLPLAGSSFRAVYDTIGDAIPRHRPDMTFNPVPGAVKQHKKLTPHEDPKLHRTALNPVLLCYRIQHEDASGLISSHASRSLPPVCVASRPQPEVVPHAHNGGCQTLTCLTVTQSYLSAQGQHVYFQEREGMWLALVQDVWGREQVLPVLCSPDQTLERAIQKLASKAPGQHKYSVHVLKTD